MLAANRNTDEIKGTFLELGVAAGENIYQGALVARDANGLLVKGQTATTLQGIGRAQTPVNNTDGADGDITLSVMRSVFSFGNSAGGDEITNADIGNDCFIVDDETVAKTDGTSTRSVAGKVYNVNAGGVWVDFR